jgi:hypothetical protein
VRFEIFVVKDLFPFRLRLRRAGCFVVVSVFWLQRCRARLDEFHLLLNAHLRYELSDTEEREDR